MNVFSPDGGYAYYGVLLAGYDPSIEPLSRCDFAKPRLLGGGYHSFTRRLNWSTFCGIRCQVRSSQ